MPFFSVAIRHNYMEIVAMGFWLIPSIDHDGCGHDPGYNLLAGPPQGIVIFFFFSV